MNKITKCPINIFIGTSSKWAYTEYVNSIKDALIIFGFDAKVIEDNCIPFSKSQFTILVGSRNMPNLPNCDFTIFCETDHIDTPLRKRSPINYHTFTRSIHWFDYKKDLRGDNIYYCPIGYSKHFDTDVCRTEKRPHFHMGRSFNYRLREDFRKKFNLWTTEEVIAGRARDEIIVSSKVNINSKLYENYWFTPLHAALIIMKGKLYMQEDCGKNDYGIYKPYIILFTEEDFKEKLDYWTSHDKERRDFEQFIHEDLKKNHKFENYLYSAIGDLLELYRR